MSTIEKISREIQSLSPEDQAEVLEFVAHLKERRANHLPDLTPEQRRRRDDLAARFADFKVSMKDFAFDRADANARG
ncbi:MAG: hypothetical protein IT565_07995 [Rhodospirillales bacterium]|nr:hypothetical protein [Rhodospirillales bacterium]